MLNKIFCCIIILTALILQTLTGTNEEILLKFNEALGVSKTTLHIFADLYYNCIGSSMPKQNFLVDDLQNLVNFPSKTTVGLPPKITSNRKFFANMIQSPSFKEMLANDVEELRKDLIKKLQFCDNTIMDENLLKELYDREVDQTKI